MWPAGLPTDSIALRSHTPLTRPSQTPFSQSLLLGQSACVLQSASLPTREGVVTAPDTCSAFTWVFGRRPQLAARAATATSATVLTETRGRVARVPFTHEYPPVGMRSTVGLWSG